MLHIRIHIVSMQSTLLMERMRAKSNAALRPRPGICLKLQCPKVKHLKQPPGLRVNRRLAENMKSGDRDDRKVVISTRALGVELQWRVPVAGAETRI